MKKYLAAILLIFCFISPTRAQLSGNYTIGGVSPDYADINAAITAVYTFTVSGPVIFNIRPGYYPGNVTLNNFNPSSIVTFQSESGNPDDVTFPFMSILSSSNATFKNLSINPYLNTSIMYPYKGMEVSTSNHILFDHCKIIGLSGSSYRFGITVVRSYGFIEIRDCSFYNLECGVSFSAYTSAGAGSNRHVDYNCIENCTFDSTTIAIHLSGIVGDYPDDTLSVKGNTITRSKDGIVMHTAAGSGKLASTIIEGNNIIDARRLGFGCYYNTPFSLVKPVIVRNNMISGGGRSGLTSGSITAKALVTVEIGDTKGLVFENNTVNGTVWMNDITTAMTFRNNCIASDSMMCVYTYNIPSFTSDYNNLYTKYSPVLVFQFSKLYPDLDSLQSYSGRDMHSISVAPWYYSSTDLHSNSPYMQFAALPIATITNDIDLESRDALTPDIGADEYHASALPPFGWFDYVCLGGGTVQFNNVSVRDVSSSWDFGDGNFSTSLSPLHTYTAPGAYSIVLIVSNSYGVDTFNYTFNLPNAPIVSVSGAVLSVPNLYTSYQWFLNGNLISGATSHTFTATTNGNYTVEVMQGYGCPVLSLPFAYVGIDETTFYSGSIAFFPNPATDYISLTVKGILDDVSISIFDIRGKLVYTSIVKTPEYKIDTKDFSSGMYFVHIRIDEAVETRKIIIAK